MKMLVRLAGLLALAGAGVAGFLLARLADECAFAPKIVAYRPGMTICPGQTVEFPRVIVPLLPLPRADGKRV